MHSEEKKRPHGVEAYLTNRIGHATGRGIAKTLWKKEWFRALASKNPELMKLASEGLVALTSLLELGGDHPIVRLANFITETLAMENLELLDQYEENPDDPELAKKVEQKIEAAVEKAGANVIVALEHIHRDENCAMVVQYVKDATPPAFAGKDGKSRSNPTAARTYPMSLSSALAAGKPLCGLCYPALSVRKAEEKEKPQSVVPGRNFMEYVLRYKAENPLNPKFKTFWESYLVRLEGSDGPDLARKFQEAFNGKHSYEAFCFVAELPDRNLSGQEEWHHALDALLGKVTPPDSIRKQIEGFIEEEKRQTEEMFRALFEWLGKSNEERAKKIVEKKSAITKLDEAWNAQRKARKTGKTARKLVAICLLAILASWYVIQRVDNASARSETSEQKVETSNGR